MTEWHRFDANDKSTEPATERINEGEIDKILIRVNEVGTTGRVPAYHVATYWLGAFYRGASTLKYNRNHITHWARINPPADL